MAYDKDYPVQIDLGRDSGPAMTDGEEGESEKVYPALFLDGSDQLGCLRSEGWALIHYKREEINIADPKNGDDDKTGARISVMELCLPECEDGSPEDDLATALARVAKRKGVDIPDAPEVDDEEDEE